MVVEHHLFFDEPSPNSLMRPVLKLGGCRFGVIAPKSAAPVPGGLHRILARALRNKDSSDPSPDIPVHCITFSHRGYHGVESAQLESTYLAALVSCLIGCAA